MIGIGPFIPHPDTPLHNAQSGSLIMALKVMALTRLLLPDINIPATTAMETLAPDGQAKALQSGANVIMPNITLDSYRRHYELYPGKTAVGGAPEDNMQRLKDKNFLSGTANRHRCREQQTFYQQAKPLIRQYYSRYFNKLNKVIDNSCRLY